MRAKYKHRSPSGCRQYANVMLRDMSEFILPPNLQIRTSPCILTQECKVGRTVAYELDKGLSHCLSECRVWRDDVGDREEGKQHT